MTGSGTVQSKNVGDNKSVTLGSLTLADGTGAASNYSLSSATMNVTQRSVILSGSRLYDGTSTAASSDLSTITGTIGIRST